MKNSTRRQFIRSATLGAACFPAIVCGQKAAKKRPLPLAFSTLGCPRWDWRTILDQAAKSGYAAIELRGLQGEMDLTKRPEFGGARLAQSLKDLAALDLRISDLGASTRLHEDDAAKRTIQLDEVKRFIDLAHHLRAPYVRVFGDKIVPGRPKQASVERVIAGLRELGRHAQGSGVAVLIESHGDFTDSATLGEILRGAEMPTTGLLWDAHHTFVAGKETPSFTYAQLGKYVRHTHLKDSKPNGKDVAYVLTGQGTVPVAEIVRTLVSNKYQGYYSFEWEKMWHPEIEEPEVAIPHFAETMRGYFKNAGLPLEKT